MTKNEMALELTKLIEIGTIKKITHYDTENGILWTIREYDQETCAMLVMENTGRLEKTEVTTKDQYKAWGMYQYKSNDQDYLLLEELPPIEKIFEAMLEAIDIELSSTNKIFAIKEDGEFYTVPHFYEDGVTNTMCIVTFDTEEEANTFIASEMPDSEEKIFEIVTI